MRLGSAGWMHHAPSPVAHTDHGARGQYAGRFYTSRHGSLTCLHEVVYMPEMGIGRKTVCSRHASSGNMKTDSETVARPRVVNPDGGKWRPWNNIVGGNVQVETRRKTTLP